MRSVSSIIAPCASKDFAGLKPLDKLASVALHDLGVLGDALAMKGRLHDAAHLTMQRILARQQSLAKQKPQRPRAERFRKGVLLRDQNAP